MRYYGCKTKLLNDIENVVKNLPIRRNAIIFDIFSGTSVVSKHFKKLGYTIYANDFLEFAYALAYSYIAINKQPRFITLRKHLKNISSAENIIDHLNNLPGYKGFITNNYSPLGKDKRQYLSIINAKRVDSIRKQIYLWKKNNWINSSEYYYLITALIEGINLVSNVTGTYAAYLKTWDARALKSLKLTPPEIIVSKNKNKAFKSDANKIVSKYKVDVLYLDPPYNGRQFAANYFFLDLITEGWFEKKPEIYGQVGMKKYDHLKSAFSIKNKAAEALSNLISEANAKYIILSYNDEGIIPIDKIRKILKTKGVVTEFVKKHKRYRSINQDGSHPNTHEILFLLKVNK